MEDMGGRSTNNKGLTFHARYLPLQYGFCVLSGFLLCLLISYFQHFETVTKTHCRKPEFFPTISASIGDMFPEKSLFRYFMALTSGPRILTLLIVHHIFKEDVGVKGGWGVVNRITMLVDVGRVFTAGLWIYIGSGEHHFAHDVGFVSYVVLTVIHQILHISMFRKYKIQGRSHPHPEDQSSYWWKMFFSIGHMLFFMGSMYYFVEHRFKCADYGTSPQLITSKLPMFRRANSNIY